MSDATRHLCAAGHLDPEFRDRVIVELWENEHRVLAPSFGVDVVPVLRHCLHARAEDVRHAKWLVALLAAGMVALFASLPVLVLMAVISFVHRLGSLSGGAPGVDGRPVGNQSVVLTVQGVVLSVYLVFIISVSTSLPSLWVLANLAVLGGVLTLVLSRAWRTRAVLRGNLAPPGSTGEPPVEIAELEPLTVRRLRDEQAGEEIVYSRDHPFVGVGLRHRAWKFTTELVPDDEDGPEPRDPAAPLLLAPDVTRAVTAAVRELSGSGPAGPGPYPHDRLRGITVRDHVMVPGFRRDVPLSGWRTDAPAAGVSRAESAMLTSNEYVRHYLGIRVDAWEQEIVASVFVRCTTQGNLLYLEASAFVMPPVNRAYHEVDRLLPDTGEERRRWLAEQLGRASGDLARLSAAISVARQSRRRRRLNARQVDKFDRAGAVIDRGPVTSVRMLGRDPKYSNLFQELDAERYITSVEDRIMAGVRSALKDAGLSTAAFDEKSREVHNQNITFNGGSFSGPMAFGNRSRADQKKD